MIDLAPGYLETVKRVLAEHAPECEVRAFGSRVAWSAKDYSDLDLALVGSGKLEFDVMRRIKEAFEESDLPIRVDILDWHAISPGFRKVIEAQYEVLQKATVLSTARSPEPTWRTSAKVGDGWSTMRFDRCADLIRDTARPSDVSGLSYIGLEHIAEGQLALTGHGSADQVTSIKSRFRKGDILFGKLRPYFRKVVIAPFDGVCSTDIWVVRHKQGIDQRYLFYWMASHEFIEESTRASEGTRMPRAQWEFVGRIEKSIPTLREQQAIACILGALDDKIELNRRMNRTLEEMARAIFKSWFVDFDPVHARAAGQQPPGLKPEIAALFPDSFEDSELGKIPRGWEVKGLDKIAQFLNGLALQKHPPRGSLWLPVIKIAQLRSGMTAGADRAAAEIDPEYIVNDGDILFSWSGSLECMLWCGGREALNQHLFKVTSHHYPRWLCFLGVHQHLAEFQHIAAGKATTMGHIQRHHLSDAKLAIPPISVLRQIDRVICPMIESAWQRSVQSRTLAAIRDTLLPKLISGELRVPDAERFLERSL